MDWIALAFKVIGWLFLTTHEQVGQEVPIDDPQLTYGGKTFQLGGAGGTPLVIKRLA